MISYTPTTGRRVSSVSGYGRHGLQGQGLRGSAAIEKIQQALAALAQATGDASINPGSVSGSVDIQTALAVISAVPKISISTSIYVALTNAVMAYNDTGDLSVMSQALESYSPQIVEALRNAATPSSTPGPSAPSTRPSTSTVRNAMRVIQSGPAGQMPNVTKAYTPPPVPRPWYKNWKIMVPVGAVVAGGAILLKRKS